MSLTEFDGILSNTWLRSLTFIFIYIDMRMSTYSFKCLNTFWRHYKNCAKVLVILQCNMLLYKIRVLFFYVVWVIY